MEKTVIWYRLYATDARDSLPIGANVITIVDSVDSRIMTEYICEKIDEIKNQCGGAD